MSPTVPAALQTAATFDPCPTCSQEVTNVRGETPYNPDIEPLAKQITAAATGFMEWFAVPCGHPVRHRLHADGRVVLSRMEPA